MRYEAQRTRTLNAILRCTAPFVGQGVAMGYKYQGATHQINVKIQILTSKFGMTHVLYNSYAERYAIFGINAL